MTRKLWLLLLMTLAVSPAGEARDLSAIMRGMIGMLRTALACGALLTS
ncbi:MAG: hypothetical protein ACR2QH_09315 [Geminicoccaceae bacterium]